VIEAGRPIPEVAEELGVHSGTLHSWVSALAERAERKWEPPLHAAVLWLHVGGMPSENGPAPGRSGSEVDVLGVEGGLSAVGGADLEIYAAEVVLNGLFGYVEASGDKSVT
jgi:hypothetical protein